MRAAAESVVPVCWAIFAIVWIVGAFTVKPVAQGQRGWRRGWFWLAVVGLLLLTTRARTAPSMNVALWSVGWAVVMGADVVTVVGLGVAIWSRVALGVYWSGNVVVKEAHVIIDRGPYRLVRHPIYFGMILMSLGTALWWGRANGLVLFAVALAGFTVKARLEERLLTEHFPAEYGAYKTRVRHALVPWLM